MEKICIECPGRKGNECEGPCPDEGKQQELTVGEGPRTQEIDWPTLPKINERLPAYKDFWLKLSPQQRVLLSFLLAGFDRKEISQHTETTEKTFSVQMNRIKAKSKILLENHPFIGPNFKDSEDIMEKPKVSVSGPLNRIELKLRLFPGPVFDEEVRFFVETKADMEPAQDLYEKFIEPMVKKHLSQLTDELAGLGVALDLVKKAEEQGLDIEEVFSNKKLRLQLLSEEEDEQ